MSINSKRNLLLVSAFALFLPFGSVKAAGNDIIVDINIKGGGAGDIITSASSSQDWEFSGWTDEFCKGRGKLKCNFQKLTKTNPQRVVASFNIPKCETFAYSTWSTCSLGKRYRTAQGIFPPGCAVENPQTVESCGDLNQCQQLYSYQGPPPPPQSEKSTASKIGGFFGGLADKIVGAVEGVIKTEKEAAQTIINYIKEESATSVADPTKLEIEAAVKAQSQANAGDSSDVNISGGKTYKSDGDVPDPTKTKAEDPVIREKTFQETLPYLPVKTEYSKGSFIDGSLAGPSITLTPENKQALGQDSQAGTLPPLYDFQGNPVAGGLEGTEGPFVVNISGGKTTVVKLGVPPGGGIIVEPPLPERQPIISPGKIPDFDFPPIEVSIPRREVPVFDFPPIEVSIPRSDYFEQFKIPPIDTDHTGLTRGCLF